MPQLVRHNPCRDDVPHAAPDGHNAAPRECISWVSRHGSTEGSQLGAHIRYSGPGHAASRRVTWHSGGLFEAQLQCTWHASMCLCVCVLVCLGVSWCVHLMLYTNAYLIKCSSPSAWQSAFSRLAANATLQLPTLTPSWPYVGMLKPSLTKSWVSFRVEGTLAPGMPGWGFIQGQMSKSLQLEPCRSCC